MSSSDTRHRRLAAALLAGLTLLTGCSVQPLYGTANRLPVAPGDEDKRRIASVEIAPVGNREGLEVRNHLIFLLNGGAGQPSDPLYRMKLKVTTKNQTVAEVQSCVGCGFDSLPTAGAIRLTAEYSISDAKTGSEIAKGTRFVSAPYDRGRQEFANYRAERDANDRAARELAEMLRLAIAHEMAKVSPN
ncbi:MAG: hypothetical protein KDJ73_10560 [Notoacmeibacter sp.]|nr:hypothetical protein [Notoacmeibacter sp.]MCC0033495.1 hypothetical protein [Brucellaceae bacterium]